MTVPAHCDPPDTDLGGSQEQFPPTRWSVLRRAADWSSPGCRADIDHLLRRYWKPIYRHIRVRWRKTNEDAKDLTQEFLAQLLEANSLRGLAPAHGSFRAYLKTALDHFLTDDHRRHRALKRGGGAPALPIDIHDLPEEPPGPGGDSADAAFDREWLRTVLAEALPELERVLALEGKRDHYEAFRLFYLHDTESLLAASRNPQENEVETEHPTHIQIAERLGHKPTDIGNYLRYARRVLRRLLRERVGEYLSSPAEAEDELRFLLEGR